MAEIWVKSVPEGYLIWRKENIKKGKHVRVRGARAVVASKEELTADHVALVKNKRDVEG